MHHETNVCPNSHIQFSCSRVSVPTLHMLPCLPGFLVRALLRAAANLLVAILPQLPSRSNALERLSSAGQSLAAFRYTHKINNVNWRDRTSHPQSMVPLLYQDCHPIMIHNNDSHN